MIGAADLRVEEPRRYLFDVNVLIALLDQAHPANSAVRHWLDSHNMRFALCPLVENGAMRIMSNPAYGKAGDGASSLHSIQGMLSQMSILRANAPDTVFWADSISLTDANLFDHSKMHGPRQLTDVYLLGLAIANGGGLLTLDRNIPRAAVRAGDDRSLWVL